MESITCFKCWNQTNISVAMSSNNDSESDDSDYADLFTGSISAETRVPLLNKYLLKSPKFLALTHPELHRYLKNVSDVAEYDLFRAIIRWATKKFQDSAVAVTTTTAPRGRKPSIFDLMKLIAPTGQEDLMKEIRVGLFTNADWVKVSNSQEADLLPLTRYYTKVFEKYFAASEAEKRRMERQDLEAFNFQRREKTGENGTTRNDNDASISAAGTGSSSRTENQTRSKSSSGLSRSLPVTNNSGQRSSPVLETARSRSNGRGKRGRPPGRGRRGGRNSMPRPVVTSEVASANKDDSSTSSDSSLLDASDNDASVPGKKRPSNSKPAKKIARRYTPAIGRRSEKVSVSQQAESPPESETPDSSSEDGDLVIAVRPEPSKLKKQSTSNQTSKAPMRKTMNNPSVREKRPAVSSERSSKQPRRSGVDESRCQPSTSLQLEPVNIELPGVQIRTLAIVSPQARARISEPELPKFEAISTTFSEYINSVNCHTRKICAEFVVRDHIKGLGLDSIVPRVFPNLEKFHLKFTFAQLKPDEDDLDERFKKFLTSTINLNKYLCFKIGNTDSRVALENLWNSNVSLSIEFHGCVIIKMNHESKELVLNCPRNDLDILRGANGVPLKKIAIGSCKFTHRLNFQEVEILVLYGVKGTTKFNDVLAKCPSLVELSLWKNEKSLEPVNLSVIPNPSKLKWLALCRTDFCVELAPNKSFLSLETLHLNNSFYSGELLKAFPKMFPKIKKLSIGQLTDRNGNGISLQFVVAVLSIPSLHWVRVCKMDWRQKNSKGLIRKEFQNLTGTKMNDPNNTSFILKREEVHGNARVWEMQILNDQEDPNKDVPGGYYDIMDSQEHEFYKLDNFYKPFSTTVPDWLTFGHFAIPCGE